MVPLNVWLILAQTLAGIKFDHFATGLRRFLDGFKDRVTIERVCLATDEKAAGFAIFRDFVFSLRGQWAD